MLFDEEVSGFLSFPFALFPPTKVGEVGVPRAALGGVEGRARPGQGPGAVSVPAPLGVLSEVGKSGVSPGCLPSRLHPPPPAHRETRSGTCGPGGLGVRPLYGRALGISCEAPLLEKAGREGLSGTTP